MRLIRRLVLLAIIGAGGVAAYNWADTNWPLRSRAAAREIAHQEAIDAGRGVAAAQEPPSTPGQC